ncbi:MAG: MBL fold metallo-hydrolase [Muribaculaceae bacterium]|nr:MBL fold metallo-hydrolase [Muribaculaceae bacterium]
MRYIFMITFSLTYIFHDCFILRSDKAVVVFDFWKRPEGWLPLSPFAGASPLSQADRDKTVYVLVSHFHKDHYNKEIFSWSSIFPNIRYIISKDVARHARHIISPGSLYSGPRPAPGSVTVLAPGESFTDDLLSVDAFDSTDIGNSYVVTLLGSSFFHAGDLNAWIWKDESTEKEVEAARNAFLSILKPIRTKYPRLDLAMFPVDSRIGTDFQEGARLLLRNIVVERFLPMHFCLGDTPDMCARLRRDALDFRSYAPSGYAPLFAGLTSPGDSIAW